MNSFLEKEAVVITPERVQLSFFTAGIGSRGIAQLLDILLLAAFNFLVFLAVAGTTGISAIRAFDYAVAVMIILLALVNIGYFIGMEYYNGGQTLGKKWIGIRVLQENGHAATFLSIMIRNLFRLLDMLPTFYFLGMAVMLFSKHDKRLGDMVAGTIVVVEVQRDWLKQKKRVDQEVQKLGSSLPAVSLAEEHRRLIEHGDWVLLSAYVDRLPHMTEAKSNEYGAQIKRHFAAKLTGGPQLGDDRTYLIWLYTQLRDEWEIG
ncbi:RDD family protein [Paenibacillus sp. OV219]|uniref:RDD family protein n=1 Tax=Paenibacillus sp. OV219 TaxID=1884377 RepID=UPI0008D28BCE|nr:RDD family protein [Paenibacillus sp. OV219]SEP00569.1 Uncharacterized membrane protein YckC, RDD family [Paenibacillus sp. OV219]